MMIFFIRRYNDVDHLAPVINAIAKSKKSEVSVYSINPDLNINDFRLEYLSRAHGIEIKHVHHKPYESRMNFFLRLTIFNPQFFKISKNVNNKFLNIFLSYIHKILRRIYGSKNFDQAIKKYFDVEWCKSFLRKNNAKVIAFDWVKQDQHIAGNIMQAAKDLEIKIFALPHGLNVMTSDLITWKEFNQGSPVDQGYNYGLIDHLVVNHDFEKKFYVKRGVQEGKIKVLGSPRFTKEWRDIYKKILKEKEPLPKKDKILKVIYFEHSHHYRCHEESVKKAIDNLAKLDFIDLIIKAHTRSNKIYAAGLEKYASNKHSLNLIKWCDVAIGVTSSIFIEVLLEKKAFILPKFFTDNTSLYEKFNVCWEVNSYKELEEALYELRLNPDRLPYGDKEIELFMQSIINNASRDVLSDYKNFILAEK